jgi:hypothetical protein
LTKATNFTTFAKTNFTIMKKLIFPFILGVLVMACSQQEDMPNSPANNDASQQSELVSLAQEALTSVDSDLQSRDVKGASVLPILKSDMENEEVVSRSYSDILPDTLLYVVNFAKEKGWAIIANNAFYNGIVAMADNGSFQPIRDLANPGIKIFLQGCIQALCNHNMTVDSLPEDFLASLTVDPSLSSAEADDSEWETVGSYAPTINAEWGQGSPYNTYCFTPTGEQALAGCGPIAVAQLLTYYQYPTTINGYSIPWASIGKYSTPRERTLECARAISEIGKQMNATYTTTSTGVKPDSIPNFLKRYGYKVQTSDSFVDLRGINSLSVYGPFLTGGFHYDQTSNLVTSGHVWVIDGALVQYRKTESSSGYRFLFHCNWGWEGSCNGYFLASAFDPYSDGLTGSSNFYFNYKIRMYDLIQKP